jgi:hypothetical protein
MRADDRLREAIHSQTNSDNGLLRPLRFSQRRSSNSARSPQGELASIMNVR